MKTNSTAGLNLFQAPLTIEMALLGFMLELQLKFDINIKDDEADEFIQEILKDFNVTWKPEVIREFRDNTSSDGWRDWADKWLEENDK